MKCMDQLPAVTSCCFCCYLRGGNIMIAMISFMVGLILAPNVSHSLPPPLLPDLQLMGPEVAAQVTLGVLSIMLCICSAMLFVGSFCNIPVFIEVYQWAALIYGTCTTCIYVLLAYFCFFVHTNSAAAGGWLVTLVFINVILTSYFIIVANSLRMSILFLNSTELA